ncbi:MAG: phosphomannomutase [Armatimonadetes bacterium]|nr:phosphomannomutase [Armatimonadota bacterium]
MAQYLPCFKAYDIRGIVPDEINPEIAYRIGRAFADEIQPDSVCLGYDIRLSGPGIAEGLSNGLRDAGVNVIDLGMIGTEMVYFATAFYGYGGGIMITASHNPPQYNGMKIVKADSRPVSGDSGLFDIERRVHEQKWERTGAGTYEKRDVYADFVQHLLSFADVAKMKPLKVLANPGNGAAGVAMEALLPHIPVKVEKMWFEPDGHFPHGVPNPILLEAQAPVTERMVGKCYDFGVAWDGDYDRCFFFDENGVFIEGYYMVGILAQAFLAIDPDQAIVYDVRLTWNTEEIIKRLGGRPVMSKSGHSFIKERMRAEDAVYGGEMSAHHYFKKNWYCDSGMIPFMLLCGLMSATDKTLGQLVAEMIAAYPCSGEINTTVKSVPDKIEELSQLYPGGIRSTIDGLSVAYDDWRFNLRGSNTEPLLRLNVESRGDMELMKAKTEELLAHIRS